MDWPKVCFKRSVTMPFRSYAVFMAAACISLSACTDRGEPPEQSDITPGAAMPESTMSEPSRETRATAQPSAVSERTARAQDNSTSEIRSADSHVHGGAAMSVVSEGRLVMVELETPLYNLIGFEYAPRTDAEKRAVMAAQTELSNPEDWIKFNDAAGCFFMSRAKEITLFSDDAAHQSSDHRHDDAKSGEQDHDHDHDYGSHKDVILSYSANCAAPQKLETVIVDIFERFPAMTTIELVYLGPSVQRSYRLSKTNITADFTP